ncbi:MAG TPA: glycoside hydrolase family 11 protein [Polyangia bacterium]|nr:glycoside hydrolase family 11 protein [Polyangia bacterium]
MRGALRHRLVLGIALGVLGCGPNSPTGTGTGGSGATGGQIGTGGSNTGGSNTGGSGTGGSHTGGSTGGNSATGGGSGGAGGAKAMGGSGGGGSPGTGGTPTGGVKGTGGAAGGAGHGATGGGSGGSTSNMDASVDGADMPCPTVPPRTGGMQICNAPTAGESGNIGSTGYSYNFWSDGKGSGCMTVYGTDAAFKANWMNVSDWIARVGLAFDKSKTYTQIGTFSSDFAYTMTGITTGGFGNIGIYGWSVSPLHEYYIAENWLGKKPNFTKVGTFTIDGEGTYDVMTNQQKNAANITGTNQDFVQFWSVRTSPRQCGHISISKHFDEWASLGLTLGNLEETRILVEGQNNSGTIDFTTATVVVTK